MKRKSALLVIICLFIGAASIQLSAQSENRTSQRWEQWNIYLPVYCDGEMADEILLVVKVHLVIHEKDGVTVWETDQIKGTGTSLNEPYETFKYREIDTYLSDNFIYLHYNAKGNMGSHYMGTMLVDITLGWGNEVFIPLRTRCK